MMMTMMIIELQRNAGCTLEFLEVASPSNSNEKKKSGVRIYPYISVYSFLVHV